MVVFNNILNNSKLMKKVIFGLSLLFFIYSCNNIDNNRTQNKTN